MRGGGAVEVEQRVSAYDDVAGVCHGTFLRLGGTGHERTAGSVCWSSDRRQSRKSSWMAGTSMSVRAAAA